MIGEFDYIGNDFYTISGDGGDLCFDYVNIDGELINPVLITTYKKYNDDDIYDLAVDILNEYINDTYTHFIY